MVYFVLLAAQAAEAAGGLNTYWPSDLPWTYDVGYTVMEGKVCSFLPDKAADEYKEIKVKDIDDLYMHQCSYKCGLASNPGGKSDKSFCEEGDDDGALKFVNDKDGIKYEVPCWCPKEADTESENVVCGDAALCEALCDSSAECYGFHMSKDSSKCVLLKDECMPQALTGLTASTDWDYFAKMDPENAGGEGCPMGLAVQSNNLEDVFGNCPEINDQYNADPEAIATFFTDCAALEWNAGACGWTVTVDSPPAEDSDMVKELCEEPQCLNKIPEANWLYGYKGDDYDELICSRTEFWLEGGYCTQNALWRALCPEECVDVTCAECEAWSADNDDAADKLVSLLDMTVAAEEGCTTLKKASMCNDPVVAVVCQGTCDTEETSRRLSADTKATLAAHQRTYSEAFRADLEKIERELSDRRLGHHETTLYASWDPTSPPTDCDPTMDPDYKSITTTPMWYDLVAWRTSEVHIEIKPVCDKQDAFKTHSDMYCNTNNMVITNPAMQNHLCFNKCNPDGTMKDPNAVDDGTCAGTDPAFNRYSNALCVTRPMCESFSQEAGTWGFEMHKSKPRCYLVDEKCPDDQVISSPLYDQVELDKDFFSYLTGYGEACPETGTMSAADVMLEREQCEATCSASENCYGFNYYFVLKQCEFFYIDLGLGVRNAVGMCSTGTFEYAKTGSFTAHNLVASTGAHFVEKKLAGHSLGLLWRLPCDVDVVVGHGVHFDGAGRYTRSECPDMKEVPLCFESPTKKYHLVWAGQDLLPKNLEETGLVERKCMGWVLDQHAADKYLYTTFSPKECPTSPVDPDAAITAGYTKMHAYAPAGPSGPPHTRASMEFVCKSYPVCGTLQTCVMAKNRFHAEMSNQYGTPAVADIAGYLPTENGAMLKADTFRPKTLISVGLSAAFIAKGNEEFATQLYRNVPGHFLIKIGELGGTADKAIIKMASADGSVMAAPIANDDWSKDGYEPWYTDIVRVELFDVKGNLILDGASVDIDFYAPDVPQLAVFKYDVAGMQVPAGYPITALQTPGMKDYYRVTVTGSGDFVATTEMKCLGSPTVPNAAASMSCSKTDAGAHCPVVCMQGYVPKSDLVCKQGEWVVATLGMAVGDVCAHPEEYEPETQFFRLAARSRMDYGWRIRQVRAFSNAQCEGKGLASVTITAPSESAIGVSPLANKDLVDVNKVGFESKCSSGTCEDYWSMGLNVNPYSVDETHDLPEGGAFLEFTVASDDPVLCVEVISRTLGPNDEPRQYYPSDAVLLRGFHDDQFRSLERSVTDVFGWTESWTAEAMEGDAAGAIHRFKTECGQADTRIFGELLMQQAGVMSACHCKQLCIDTWQGTETGGCLSWNFQVEPFNMCFLQSSIKPMASESCAPESNVISGFTGLRIDGIETIPKNVKPGEAFTLKVNGVNMPAEENAFLQMTTPTRQRVKIVPVMTGKEKTSCADGEIADTVEGIGCSHPFFCAPRPSSYSMSSATWADLTIYGTSKPSETYLVCYNRGFTYDRYEWHAIGEITVDSGAYVWEAPDVTRTTETFALTVKEVAFTTSNPDEWDVKFVKSYFDCSAVTGDAKLFPSDAPASTTRDLTARTVEYADIAVYNAGAMSFAEVGKYKVCLDTGAGGYMQIPGENGEVYLEIHAEDGYSTHAKELYSYQKLSGKIDAENDFTLEGFRLSVPTDSSIGFFDGDCGNGGAFTGFTAKADSSKSSADGYVFTGTPTGRTADHTAGDYNICFCNDQTPVQQTALEIAAGPESRYIVTENTVCKEEPGVTDVCNDDDSVYMCATELAAENVANLCAIKCSRGCVGPDCFCDSFDPATAPGSELSQLGAEPPQLCLDASGCKAACELESGCEGFNFFPDTNFCQLLTVNSTECTTGFNGDAVYWDRLVNHTSCNAPSQFSTHLGTVSLTSRVEVGVDWVLTPQEISSIEVLGTDLNWKNDRIMVIDYTGICGVSSVPKDSVMLAKGLTKVPLSDKRAAHWVAHLAADFKDDPAEQYPGCGPNAMETMLTGQTGCDNCAGMGFVPDLGICTACTMGGVTRVTEEIAKQLYPPMMWCPETKAAAAPAAVAYTKAEDKFCAGNNAGMSHHKDQCYSKCIEKSPCEGADCFCQGVLQGYDGADSDALCLDEDTCLEVCASMEDCVGIDMHNTLPRCFINLKASKTSSGSEESCEFYVDYGKLTPDADYSYMYKQAEGGRRLTDELGLLRFEGIEFATGGQYKACFCDVDTLEGGKYCKKASDYKIEIGTIHVSGVSCLVENKKFQRGTCVNQGVGGLRCYPGKAPTYVEPAAPAPTVSTVTVEDEVFDPVHSTFCLYGPEEETSDDPFCA
jgi:hypothetical protein